LAGVRGAGKRHGSHYTTEHQKFFHHDLLNRGLFGKPLPTIKRSLEGICGVANARHADRYGCALRLAAHSPHLKLPLEFNGSRQASPKVPTYTGCSLGDVPIVVEG